MRAGIILFLLFLQGPVLPFPFVPQSSTLNACLVSGYAMNEGSGTTLHDSSTNANTATIHNPAQISWGTNAGFPGSSLTITGANPLMEPATNSFGNFNGSTPFSLAAWVSITSSAANEIILSNLQVSTDVGWEITSESISTNTLEFLLISTNTSNELFVHGSTNIINTGKHYVVATYDGSKTPAGVKLYVDGTLESMTTTANSLTGATSSTSQFNLGERPADQNTMRGVLAAPAIYNCVLTPTQISTYFGRGPQVN